MKPNSPSVAAGGKFFDYHSPGDSLVTFVW
jgi:hypothetical protein